MGITRNMLTTALSNVFNRDFYIVTVKPLHDEDFEEFRAVCTNGVIVGNEKFSLEKNIQVIANQILTNPSIF